MDFLDIILRIYSLSPGTAESIGVGLFASTGRMAFDDRNCDQGWDFFCFVWYRHFMVAVVAVVVANGISSYFEIPDPLSVSISILSGFFARELFINVQQSIKAVFNVFLDAVLKRFGIDK